MSQMSDVGEKLITLTGNNAIAVHPTLGNINLVGAGGVVVTGVALTNTLTITGGAGATTFASDAGNAAPALGVITMAGGTNIGSTGAGSTITFNLVASPSVAGSLTAATFVQATAGNITASAGNLVATLGNLVLPATIATGLGGVITVGGVKFINNMGATNTFIGGNAGNLGLTVATTTSNTACGFNSMLAVDGGVSNTACGATSLIVVMGGDYNTGCGSNSLAGVTSGSYNIGLGYDSGSAATIASSSNIFIGNVGAAESNTIRIGTQGNGAGQQDKAYMAGIYGASCAAATTSIITTDSVGKLGALALATSGQTILGSTGAAPVWGTISSTGGTINVTVGAGTLNLDVISSGMIWSREAGNTVALVDGHGYIPLNGALTTFTLPASAALGTVISIMGESAWLWKIAQRAGQNIQFGQLSTTPGVGGSLSATNAYDTVTLVCRVADTTWSVLSNVGILSVV